MAYSNNTLRLGIPLVAMILACSRTQPTQSGTIDHVVSNSAAHSDSNIPIIPALMDYSSFLDYPVLRILPGSKSQMYTGLVTGVSSARNGYSLHVLMPAGAMVGTSEQNGYEGRILLETTGTPLVITGRPPFRIIFPYTPIQFGENQLMFKLSPAELLWN